ncbi:MAG: hypothetical protein HY692_04970, partial [Cyanobacteria bacterium NC_groundwater_1444_Ag_S-0.65um_54_12]|nr:hypothetical protein [Cyanobacteria bacterium NC_groundwater_1444_Ag_S-0.65um_54_12]
DLGQLGPLQAQRTRPTAQHFYLQRCEELGQKSGNIKPAILHRATGWSSYLVMNPS